MKNFLTLSFALLLIGPGAGAGDWKSAGYPEEPYLPKYAYEYSCELELVGDMTEDGQRHVAEGTFKINGNKEDARIQWKHRLYHRGLDFETLATPIPFRTEGHEAYVYFRPGGGPGKDRVIIALELEEILDGKYAVSFTKRETYTRADNVLRVQVSMGSRRLDGSKHDNQSGYLTCVKVK